MATAGEGTPKNSSRAKPKQLLTIQGFKYSLGTTRKDGSETWKCTEKDCEGRVHKKDKGQVQTMKDHSIQNASTSGVLYHLYMCCLKERAVKFPNESPAELRKHVTHAVTEIVISSVPSPNAIETAIKEWRESGATEETKKSTRTPKSKDGSKMKMPKSSRKRLKLTTGDGNKDLEDEDDEDEERTPSKSMRKRSRSKSVDNLSEEEEDENTDSEEE